MKHTDIIFYTIPLIIIITTTTKTTIATILSLERAFTLYHWDLNQFGFVVGLDLYHCLLD